MVAWALVGVLIAMRWATPEWARKEEKPRPIDGAASTISDVVIAVLRQVEEQLEAGFLVTIDRSRLRIRLYRAVLVKSEPMW
jgi:hypothetical protein